MPYLNIGNIYLERGELDSALKAFQSVLELEDGNLRAHLALGKIYLEKRDYGRAEVHLEAVTRLNPSQNRQAFVALIQIEIMSQKYDRAKYFLNNFQMYFPSDPEIEKLKQAIEKQGLSLTVHFSVSTHSIEPWETKLFFSLRFGSAA